MADRLDSSRCIRENLGGIVRKIIYYFGSLFCSIAVLCLLTSCGKHEAASGAVGTASGAALGASLAGKRDKGTGALLGALVGNYVGRRIGKSADKAEEDEERLYQERRHCQDQRECVQRFQDLLKKKIEDYQKELKKWCVGCRHHVTIAGARRCPDCGDGLIREKVCDRCHARFKPNVNFRYCPYCTRRVLLSYR